ncbi:MrcB family domain-containing protein [Enterococcus sp.]|uniref:MrcB family domain-containing protein n=1 Tax=Enterococcus sp. TaxID=35783 RepID=UPI002FCA6959
MTINDLFEVVGNSFEKESNVIFKENWLANKIRKDAKDVFSMVLDEEMYNVKGAPGEGRWATIPWFGIINKKYSTTFQNGFYVVYLFSSDYKTIYLCLSQGITDTYKGILGERDNNISKVVSYWRRELNTYKNIFSTNNISLLKTANITNKVKKVIQDYEKVNICSIKYEISQLPNVETMLDDLSQMLVVYEELNSKLINGSYRNTIEFILSKETIEINKDEEKAEYTYLDNVSISCLVNSPTIDLIPKIKSNGKSAKVNYEEQAKISKRTGYEGELFAFEFEKKRLRVSSQLEAYVDKIEHVSVSKGDGLGYDILSYELDPDTEKVRERYIEVKSTKGGRDSPFYLSLNELLASKEKGEQYHIYRVYELYQDAKLYVVSGDMEYTLNLLPINYLAGPR